MSVNLLNPNDINNYLSEIIFEDKKQPSFKASDLKSYDFVANNTDLVAKSMVFQWAKARVSEHLLNDEKSPFISNVNISDDLPNWAQNALKSGKPVHKFDKSKIPSKLNEDIKSVYDFLYAMADKNIKENLAIAKQKSSQNVDKVRVDYLKTVNEYSSFERTLHASSKWHELLLLKSENKKNADLEKSEEGTSLEMEFKNGMKVLRLNTPEALDFESDMMGHCVGKGSYDAGVEFGTKEIYSLRDKKGMPHVTIEVMRGRVMQCKGKGNKAVNARYLKEAKEFIAKKNLAFMSDYENLGIFKDANGTFVDVFTLSERPGRHSFKKIDLSNMGLESLPDMTSAITDEFICTNNKLKNLNGMPSSVRGNVDCSNNPSLESFEGVPHEIAGGFLCKNTGVKSLKGTPQTLTYLDASENQNLSDLNGVAKNMISFNLTNCPLINDKAFSPEYVKKIRFISGLDRDVLDRMVENDNNRNLMLSKKNAKTI